MCVHVCRWVDGVSGGCVGVCVGWGGGGSDHPDTYLRMQIAIQFVASDSFWINSPVDLQYCNLS